MIKVCYRKIKGFPKVILESLYLDTYVTIILSPKVISKKFRASRR